MSFLYLNLAILSSLGVALLFGFFERSKCNRTVVIASNYIVAGTLGCLFAGHWEPLSAVHLFGVVLGFFFFLAFMVYGKAIKQEGIASAVTMGRLSLAVPVGLSILLWGESPRTVDILGLLIIFAVFLTWEGKIGKPSPLLASLFLLFGGIDASIKFFKMQFGGVDDGFFLILVYFSGMVWSWLYVIYSRRRVTMPDVGRGLLLGVPNYFSTFFLLAALQHLPAYVAFPYLNVALIILSALSGYLFFKEKLSGKRVLLILLGMAAVFLLTV
ncbi:MAG: hypothetical protein GY765_03755 [bacterium]|nr:hypothetical protein [bacterium]